MTLPPLYFSNKGLPLSTTTTTTTGDKHELPPELLATILNAYGSYSDYARLACVQDAWKDVLYDAAASSVEEQWNLAAALLEGTNGLQQNPTAALGLLYDLAAVDVDPTTQAPIIVTPKKKENEQNAQQHAYVSRAMQTIGHLYLDGTITTVPSTTATGVAWLQAAYTVGHDAHAAYDVAILYEYGQHQVPVDVVAAAAWFHHAAAAGHTEAMAELGLCYELGCGVEADDATALDWYYKAAEGGHVTAKYSVAEIFEEARGVPQSDAEACRWYYRAALVGDEDSLRALRRLESIARIAIPGVGVLLDG